MEIEELLAAWAKQVIRAQTAEATVAAQATQLRELQAQKPEEPVDGTR